MKYVEVKWYDSYSCGNWTTKKNALEEYKELVEITSIGMLFHENKNCVVLCHSEDKDNLTGLIHIPKCSITKVTELTNKTK